jgi:citrate lyase subunit beta/citryl-CoA lyase
MTIACRAAGLDAIDGPFGNFKDPQGYRTECERARIIGCVGKWAIHPSQIEIARECFTPSLDDVAKARKLAAAYAEAEAQGLGAINVDGNLVDAASVRLVGNILKRAEILGL